MRGLGVGAIAAGTIYLAALVVALPEPLGFLWGMLITIGPICLIAGVQLRAWRGGNVSRPVMALAVGAIAAEAWWLAMSLLAIGRERPMAGDFGAIWSWAIISAWVVGAAFFFLAAHRRLASRWAAVALAVGYLMGLLGNDRLGLVDGPYGDLAVRAASTGFVLIGFGWLALGLDLILDGQSLRGTRVRGWTSRIAVAALLIAVVAVGAAAMSIVGARNGATASIRNELRAAIEDVAGATARRYVARDDRGHEMDGAKIIEGARPNEFVAVYHAYREGDDAYDVHLATSTDLLTWTWRIRLSEGGSQPTIRAASDGGYVVAWETDAPNHLKFAYYPTWEDLLAGRAAKTFEPRRTLSTCAEGTPSLDSASSTALEVGFHFYDDCEVDRQAHGSTDWTTWTAEPNTDLEATVRVHGVRGAVGDRDRFTFRGSAFTMIEGQAVNNDWTTWRVYLHDHTAGFADLLDIRTDAGSTAFTNPAVTQLEIGGRTAILVTLFVPMEGARGGEEGALIYYRLLDR